MREMGLNSRTRFQSSSNLELRSFILVSEPHCRIGRFTEGHELDRKTIKQVPKAMIGRRLSQEEAKRLLAKLKHQ
jgi:hypothetical protein